VSEQRTEHRRRIGDAVLKRDGIPKTQGSFAFSGDLYAAGMLHGVTVRSPHPHAVVRGIDATATLDLPGVHAVLTHADVPGEPFYGLEFRHQPVLAIDRVRYVGEAVAVVAADHPDTARRAAGLVAVDYELLEPVVDAELATTRPPLHDPPPMGPHHRPDDRPNVVRHLRLRHGDPGARGDVVVEGEYVVGMQDQAFLGTESGLAIPDGTGGIDIYVATQWLHVDREQVAPCLALAPDRVRIHLAGVGGAFGGREDLSMQVHAAMLALHTGRPVKMVYSREESFTGHVHRHPARLRLTHHADRDGRLVAVHGDVLIDGGPYASTSAAVIGNAVMHACGPYRVPNVAVDGTAVYTNNPPCGAMRGFGAVQACVAHEAQMDRLAAELGIDAVELRLRNALAPGDVLPSGEVITGSLPVADVIRRCAALEPPSADGSERDPLSFPGGAGGAGRGEALRRGRGFAVGFKNIAYSEGFDDYATARIRLHLGADERLVAEVHWAGAEVGQGSTDVVETVVRTELPDVEVVLAPAGTATVGSSGSSSASRLTWMAAGAMQLACQGVRAELARRGGSLTPGEEIDVEREYHHRPTSPIDPETGQVLGERVFVAFAACAMAAEVEVDVQLGLSRVTWIGCTVDAGRAVNPLALEGQVHGGTAQGIGLAVMEELIVEGGHIRNASFTDYLIPTILDVPTSFAVDVLEQPEPNAPYGVKGVGEPPTVVATAAVAAALRDATGHPLRRVPVRLDDLAGLTARGAAAID